MGSPSISHPIEVLAACCAYEPGSTTCAWITPDEQIHTETFRAEDGEDPPVFKLVKKPGFTARFNLGAYRIELDPPVRVEEPMVQQSGCAPDTTHLA